MIEILKILLFLISFILFLDIFIKTKIFSYESKNLVQYVSLNNYPLLKIDNRFVERPIIENFICDKDFFKIDLNINTCDICGNMYYLKEINDDKFTINGLILPQGQYCIRKFLKKSFFESNNSTMTSQGWKKIDLNLKLNLLCKNLNLSDMENEKNFLFDFFLEKKITMVELEENVDIYEKYRNNFRYRCKCFGKDNLGNPLIENIYFPHFCFRNYCNTVKNGEAVLDLVFGYCNCGKRGFNIDYNNPQSKCTSSMYKLNLNKSKLIGYFRCFSKFSSIKEVEKFQICNHEMFENSDYGITNFDIDINFTNDHLQFMDY